jgi:Tfp pilus assembly protein PilZ
MGAMATNKRTHERHIRDDFSVTLLRDGRELRGFDMLVCDISRGGVGLQLAAEVRVGDQISMRLDLPGTNNEVVVGGAVRWVDETPMGYRCGVAFADLGYMAAYKIGQFLNPLDPTWLGSVDAFLWAAVSSVMALAGVQAIGWELASPAEIIEFYVNLIP